MASALLLSSLKRPLFPNNVLRTPSKTAARLLLPAINHEEPASRQYSQGGSCWATPSLQLSFKQRGTKVLQAKSFYTCTSVEVQGVELEVAMSVEGSPLGGESSVVEDIASALSEDAVSALREALELRKTQSDGQDSQKDVIELSIVLCDDAHIAKLNEKWRNVPAPTDVLAFPLDDDEDNQDGVPIQLLGDVVISLDTADRQAQERQMELLGECRILLVHGILHLLGLDHDKSPKDWKEMAKSEEKLMDALGWEGKGLIDAATGTSVHPSISQESPGKVLSGAPVVSWARSMDRINLVALDLDGTLLSSRSEILESSREAILAAISKGVKVMLSTGKTRPAALSACGRAGLEGDGLVISRGGPGVFLQGLAVHDWSGNAVMGPDLSPDFVESALCYCEENNISCIAFLGDECATMKMTPDVQEMHDVYYEPLSQVRTLPEILSTSVKKLVLIADPEDIRKEIQPLWKEKAVGTGASVMLAVKKHLELVPEGANKWYGLEKLVNSSGLPMESVMAMGDGGNDVLMVKGVGIGVAVGNATDEVKDAADYVVASHDDDGVAEAFERFVL